MEYFAVQICKGVGERLANDQGFYCEQLKEFGLSKGRLRAGMIAVYECLHYSEGIWVTFNREAQLDWGAYSNYGSKYCFHSHVN